MPYSPYKIMFSMALISGSILSISSTSWFSAWVGLELNLMSFIPLISSSKNKIPSEASLKYFLVQALGSALIIFSSSLIIFSMNPSFLVISLALLLKLGAAPFHFWFPQVMEGLNWIQAIILMTIQKLAPMFLISFLPINLYIYFLIFTIALTSAIVGALGGMNQTSLRKILTYSSINHISWMLFSMLINETLWITYFIMYSIISTSVALLFHSLQAYYFTHLMNNNKTAFSKIVSMLSLYSLGGLPPFSGFIPKWIVVQEMINSSFFTPLAILLMTSLVTLYFYIRLTLSTVSFSYVQNKWTQSFKPLPSMTLPFFSFLNLFGLLIPSMLMTN
uniref:NADH-ubiquinone oxidoreductase chain 2 n=1 Tax=Euastacus spinifer TaxID=99766 RepID=A0A0B4VJG5_9EUCA|nr:NADH dehydrogenase subunit 2 [Euastacus spinifer]AJD22595.1 NADH dehydrogenase subunit 2 [Euastacus spinifer]